MKQKDTTYPISHTNYTDLDLGCVLPLKWTYQIIITRATFI